MLPYKGGHHNEKPENHNEEWPLLAPTRESPCAAMKTQCSQKKKKKNKTQIRELINIFILIIHNKYYDS